MDPEIVPGSTPPVPTAPAAPPSGDSAPVVSAPAVPVVPAPVVVPPEPVAPSPEDSAPRPGETSEQTAQRLKDTQAAFHAKAAEAKAATTAAAAAEAENVTLRTRLTEIYSHPDLAPLVAHATGTPGEGADPELEAAYEKYKLNPDDKAAWLDLVKLNEERATKRVMATLHTQDIERANQARIQTRQRLIYENTSATVQKVAPDVPLELFWSAAVINRAQAETPATLTHPAERNLWQMRRAIELSRAILQPHRTQAITAAAEAAAAQTPAGAVMPGGGAAPRPAGGGAEAPIPTFAEQMRSLKPKPRPG